jgi:GTPase SAR1 family protein
VSCSTALREMTQWELSGDPHDRSFVTAAYKNACIALIVYDTTRQSTYDNIPSWYDEVVNHRSITSSSDTFTTLVVGNKCDRERGTTAFSEVCTFPSRVQRI